MKQSSKDKAWPTLLILLSVVALVALHYHTNEGKTAAQMQDAKVAAEKARRAQAEAAPEDASDEPSGFEAVGSFEKDPEVLALETSSDPDVRELGRLLTCSERGDCDYPEDTPTSYDLALTKDMVAGLRRLASFKTSDESARASRLFMNYPNDDVKSAALTVLAKAEKSDDNLHAILSGLQESVSAPLYEQAVDVLERYKGSPALDRFLLEVVKTGGHFASIELARHSIRFLSAQNAKEFQAIVREMPLRSQARTFLELNLQEYERLQNGG